LCVILPSLPGTPAVVSRPLLTITAIPDCGGTFLLQSLDSRKECHRENMVR
jgi:hypothetical protein